MRTSEKSGGKVPEVGEVAEVGVRGLDVDESGDLLQRGEDVEPVGVHARISRSEREVGVDLLEAVE